MSRSLIGYVDAHEGHSASLAGSATQARVSDVLRKVLTKHPNHPGALHYLLHNDDDPEHAHEALDAARALASLVPDASHALHMPAHIFCSSDRGATPRRQMPRRSRRRPHGSRAGGFRRRSATTMHWHGSSMNSSSRGGYREARATLGEVEPVVARTGELTLLSDLSSMRARLVVESANWALLAKADTFGNVNELFALGLSAARTGDAARAERARAALAEKQHDEREGDLRPAIAIMERELAAVNAFAAGRRDDALTIARAAADAEAGLPAPLGLPEPIKPAPELLGELLIDAERADQADAWFARALERNPNRSLSELGRARAAAATGDAAGAQQHYRRLLDNFSGADSDLPVLTEARAAQQRTVASSGEPLDRRPTPRWRGLFASTGGLLIVALGVGAIVGMIVVARSRAATAHRSLDKALSNRETRAAKKTGPRERAREEVTDKPTDAIAPPALMAERRLAARTRDTRPNSCRR